MERNYNNDSAINLPAINNPYGGSMQIRTLRNEGRHHNNTITVAPNQPIKGLTSHRPSMSTLLARHIENHGTSGGIGGPDYQGFSVISQAKKLHEPNNFMTPHKLRSNSTLTHTASGLIINDASSQGRVSPL